MKKKTVIYLLGPTASGKTALALRLAKRLPVHLISVDSALVYRGLDIGTAKPSAAMQQRYPHALIDIREPTEAYSVANFVSDCRAEIITAERAGKIPLCVGGTMMYYQALSFGLAQLPDADSAVRQRLEREAQQQGLQAQHKRLAAIDPQAAARIHPNDPQRLQRALEVYELTGKTMSHWLAEGEQQGLASSHEIKAFAIAPSNRAVLHKRIEARFLTMLQQGFLQEMQSIMAIPGIHAQLPAMRAVGYRQAWQHLSGQLSLAELQQQAIAATRQLAKRQLTWCRNSRLVLHWMDADEQDAIEQILRRAFCSPA